MILAFLHIIWYDRDRKGAVGQGEMVKGAYLVIKLYVKLPSAQ